MEHSKLNTLDMEIALMQFIGVVKNMVVPNVSWGIAGLHECDILSLSRSNYATEIEIKISRSDLLKDFLKPHGHRHNHIKYFYYAVPPELKEIALQKIPKRSGLYIVHQNYKIEHVRPPIKNKLCVKWSDKERLKLAHLGTMRLLGMKTKLRKVQKISKNSKK